MLAGSAARADVPSPFKGASDAPFFPPPERYPLWPGSPPGAPTRAIVPNWTMNGTPPNRELDIRGVPFPELYVYRPARPDGSALLVFPGGGYEFLSVQNEGLDAAERFNSERTTVFVLSYRLPAEGWLNRSLAPLQDAQRAMRLIRSRSAEFSIDRERLGVIGFSAGGHLASDLGVSYDDQVYQPIDSADRQSARPSFLGLIYPVTTLGAGTHGGSRDNLLGPNPLPQIIERRSPVLHVNARTPPCFVLAAFDDDTVPIQNSLGWIAACRSSYVPIEAHLLAEGGHGFGFHLPANNSGSRWPELFALWMRRHGA